MKRKSKTQKAKGKIVQASLPILSLPKEYPRLLEELKKRIRASQIRTALASNQELILLYWDIGKAIVLTQKEKGYGKKVVERLAKDLFKEFPEMNGFSERNLWFMRSFYLAYTEEVSILKQPVSESSSIETYAKEIDGLTLPRACASIPWGHNVIIIQKLKAPFQRLWYAQQTIEHGWSRNVLAMQIESDLYHRQGKAISNFSKTLPPLQSDLVQQTLKDPYVFDFLTMTTEVQEREIEQQMLLHIQQMLLELGKGFAFVGRRVQLEVGKDDFYLDLLFYHLHLRCYVVIELKAGSFKPEYAGKLNFYLSAVDTQFRHPDDKPTIGLLLCKEKNRLTVEYALRDINKPIGVAEWKTKIMKSLPKQFKQSLPTIEELEHELLKHSRKRLKQNDK